MHPLRLYPSYQETTFLGRPNRFTLLLKHRGKAIKAYLPNTGRLEEYLVDGGVFFITSSRTEKFRYRAVSTVYQESFVLIDTAMINSLAETLIREDLLPGFTGIRELKREKSMGRVRPDFYLTRNDGKTAVLEVKTCTLCHNGVALFPDAPSARACRHVENFAAVRADGHEPDMAFIVPNGSARSFMPNFHTDRAFSERVLGEDPSAFRAYSVSLVDPVTANLDSVREIPIDFFSARSHTGDRGSYLLVLSNDRRRTLPVGKLGTIAFEKGFYVYVGSALGSLDGRLKRHNKRLKGRFWHIDYLSPVPMDVERAFPIRRGDRIESRIASRLEGVSTGSVKGFGASDSTEQSHLFYFKRPPHRSREFLNVLFDFKTFTDSKNDKT